MEDEIIEELEEELEPTEQDMEVIVLRREEIAEVILSKRDEAIRARAASGVERRWRDDEYMFDGINHDGRPTDMVDYASGEASVRDLKGKTRSKISINIVRGRSEVAEGRFSDVTIPTDGKNWGLKPTPDPKLDDLRDDNREAQQNNKPIKKANGETATVGDVAIEKQRVARHKMKKMETEINDKLVECDFNAELRKCIRNACRLGTGIMKGPSVIKQMNSKWVVNEEGYFEHKQEEVKVPTAISVSPWSVFPDPQCNDDIKRAAYVWERDLILPRDLRKLIGVDGYDEVAIRKVLDEEPKRADVRYDKTSEKYRTYDQVVQKGSAYERWEYYGEVGRDDLCDLGCDFEGVGELAASMSACVVFVNDTPIKAVVNILDSGELPFDFFKWTAVNDTPWGIGIPRQLLDVQRVMTGAWRSMMDNAGDSSGANYIFGQGIQPVDGHWELTGKKAWRDTTSTGDVRQSFNQFQVENNQAELKSIIDMALQFADLETGLPTIFQGEVAKTPETLGATNIMVDSANITLRQRVKLFVDDVIDPMLTRFYHWMMQYSDKDDIKGDYQVDAHGPGVLLERDTQTQSLVQLFSLKNDPDVGLVTDWEKVIKQLYQNQRLDVLASDEEIAQKKKQAQQNKPPETPAVQAAKIRSESELQKAKMDSTSSVAAEKLKLQRTQEDNKFKASESEKERAYRLQVETMKRDIAMMELAESSKMTLEEIKADLAKTSVTVNAQKEIAAGNSTGPQIAEPIVEPPGRAPNGQAFQK